ncbi:MAG: glycosyltransferase family 4 protein [Acidimicrobiales bacterium]
MSRTAALIGGSLVAAVVATRAAAATARRLGVVDPPGPLKPQASAVPYLGGVGVLAGAAVGAASAQPLVLIPLSLATALGTADDCMDLSPSARLAGQIAIGIVGAMTVRTRLASPIGPVLVAGTSVLLTNGVNLIDGLDGLAGGVAAVASGAFALMLEGDARLVAGSLALGCIGFLTYNRPPARVYLGDGGSYLIGTSLALLLASAWRNGVRPEVGVAGLLLVAVPAAEVAFAVVRRRRSRRSVVAGDRGHPYDRLVERGLTPTAAAMTYVSAELALGIAAVLSSRARTVSVPAATAGAVAAVMLTVAAASGMLDPDSEPEP